MLFPPPLCSQFLLTGKPGLPAMPSLHSDVVLSPVVHTAKDFISFILFLYCYTVYFCCPIILFGLIWFQPRVLPVFQNVCKFVYVTNTCENYECSWDKSFLPETILKQWFETCLLTTIRAFSFVKEPVQYVYCTHNHTHFHTSCLNSQLCFNA